MKKKIEEEFTETVDNYVKEQVNEVKKSKPKKIIVKKDKKSEKKTVTQKTIKK